MLSKEKRLNLKTHFKFVAAGKKIDTPLFKLFLQHGTNFTPLIGIALSKNQFRKAHDKNKAKRKASQAIEALYSNLPKNLNLVIMPKSQILNSSNEQVLKELKNVKELFNFTN